MRALTAASEWKRTSTASSALFYYCSTYTNSVKKDFYKKCAVAILLYLEKCKLYTEHFSTIVLLPVALLELLQILNKLVPQLFFLLSNFIQSLTLLLLCM